MTHVHDTEVMPITVHLTKQEIEIAVTLGIKRALQNHAAKAFAATSIRGEANSHFAHQWTGKVR